MKKYIKLLKRIYKIDRDAARYIVEEVPKLASYQTEFAYNGNLPSLFIWSESPQGTEYWGNINNKLKGLE